MVLTKPDASREVHDALIAALLAASIRCGAGTYEAKRYWLPEFGLIGGYASLLTEERALVQILFQGDRKPDCEIQGGGKPRSGRAA